jgi:hypothetical protein
VSSSVPMPRPESLNWEDRTSSVRARMVVGALALTLVEVEEVDNQYKCLLGDVANTCFGYTRQWRLELAISVRWLVFESSSGLPLWFATTAPD